MKWIPAPIFIVFKWYLLGLVFFTFFRGLLFFSEISQLNSLTENAVGLSLQAFFMGLRFDTVISAYILALPFLVLSVACIFIKKPTKLIRVLRIVVGILYLLSFLICCIDIPFFNYTFNRVNAVIFAWADTPKFVANMIFQEFRYFVFGIVFILVGSLYIFCLRKLPLLCKQQTFHLLPFPKNIVQGFILLTFTGLIFLGMRGRIEKKSPIVIGTAYFCNHAFLNQLGLNPVFTLMRSLLDAEQEKGKQIALCDPLESIAFVQKEFGCDPNINPSFPLSRKINPRGEMQEKNIILILMESMSAEKMKAYGNSENLTPFLDSLSKQSLCFNKIYTAGIHTHNGIFSTLFSYPAPLAKHSMNVSPIPTLQGISHVCKEKGYQTFYFTTHDDQFDNVGGFLRNNNFDHVISQKDYPAKEVKSTLGVPDHILFEQALPYLNKAHDNDHLFFACLMTSSDHGPYILPTDIPFQPSQKEIQKAIIQYADWSLSKFMAECARQPWFDNTLFVFIADHGAIVNPSTYELPLEYHHTPLLFYAPHFIRPAENNDLGLQIDVFPTIMGLLNIEFTNTTLGQDLLQTPRKYAYFSSDDKIGVLDETHFLIFKPSLGKVKSENQPWERAALFKYKEKDPTNYIAQFPEKADSMSMFARFMIQGSCQILGR